MLGEGADYSDWVPSVAVRHPSFRRLGPRLGVLHVAFHGVVAGVEHAEGRHAVHPVRRALAERVGLGVEVVRRVVVVDEVADVLVAPREEGVAREEVAVVNEAPDPLLPRYKPR